jgi:hypothetical protein
VTRTPLRIALLTVAVVAMLAVPTALAGKGGKPGGGGGGGSTTGGSGSFSLVLLDSTDGLPHYGQRITFNVVTSASSPFVAVNCYQGSSWVYAASVGYFDAYPWAKEFILAATSWPGGDADCSARLYTTKDGTKTTTLATMSFHVYA